MGILCKTPAINRYRFICIQNIFSRTTITNPHHAYFHLKIFPFFSTFSCGNDIILIKKYEELALTRQRFLAPTPNKHTRRPGVPETAWRGLTVSCTDTHNGSHCCRWKDAARGLLSGQYAVRTARPAIYTLIPPLQCPSFCPSLSVSVTSEYRLQVRLLSATIHSFIAKMFTNIRDDRRGARKQRPMDLGYLTTLYLLTEIN